MKNDKQQWFIKKYIQRAVESFGGSWGVIVSENHSSLSIAMGLLADPISSSQKKEKVVDWLSHISRFRDLGVVFSHKLRHLLRLLHYSKLVSFQGCLRHMMFDKILSHHFHLVRDLDGMSVRAKKFQRSFLTLGFVLGQAKFLPVTQDCCWALKRSFLALMWVKLQSKNKNNDCCRAESGGVWR